MILRSKPLQGIVKIVDFDDFDTNTNGKELLKLLIFMILKPTPLQGIYTIVNFDVFDVKTITGNCLNY